MNTKLINELKKLEAVYDARDDVKKTHTTKLAEHKESTPVLPRKKPIVSISPSISFKGIAFLLSIALCVIAIILSVSSSRKHQAYESIISHPCDEYIEWCYVLADRGTFDAMTEEEWTPVQKAFQEQGVTITWEDLITLHENGGLNIETMRYDISKPILEGLLGEESHRLYITGCIFIFLTLVCIVLIFVFKSGCKDNIETIKDILTIPRLKHQNKINKRYNETEYVAKFEAYQNNLKKHEEDEKALHLSYEKNIKQLDKEIKELEESIDFMDYYKEYISRMIEVLENESASTLFSAYELAEEEDRERQRERQRELDAFWGGERAMIREQEDRQRKELIAQEMQERKEYVAREQREYRERRAREQEERARRDEERRQAFNDSLARHHAYSRCSRCANEYACGAAKGNPNCGSFVAKK